MASFQTRTRRPPNHLHPRRRCFFEPLEQRNLLAVLFADSFEVPGANPPEWLNWVEDGQNDWFRSTRRAVDGSYAAEVDGRATDATLTMANPLDLTGYSSAELTFSWFIESNWDSGEYIALDLHDGNSWNEVAALRGNVDQEHVWHSESVTIDSNYLVDDFKIRFRAKVSRSSEDGHVDDVQLIATNPTPPDLSISDAFPAEGDVGELISNIAYRPRGMTLELDGSLYVASGEDDRVLRFDAPTGQYLGDFVPSGSGLDNPQDVVFGPDGHLYVASGNGDSVLRFNGATGALIDTFVSTSSGGLDFPVGLQFTPQGDLLVASYYTNEVLRYDGNSGAFLGAFVTAGSGGLGYPTYMAFGPDGHLYVSNGPGDSVERFSSSTGAHIDEFVPRGSGGLDEPRGIYFDNAGSLYVVSARTNEVLRYDAATASFLDILIPKSEGVFFPIDLVQAVDGAFYVTSREGSDLLRFREQRAAEFTVSLSHASDNPVTVDYASVDGNAAAGDDYAGASGNLTFAPGVTEQTIVIPVIDDSLEEPLETFDVQLSNISGGSLVKSLGVAIIADDDTPPAMDPQFDDQWNLHNTGQFGASPDADIDAPEAWSVTTGSTATVVAVIDTGIDYTHHDLYLNIWLNQNEIPATLASSLVDTDGDGIIGFRDLNDAANSGYVTDQNNTGYIDGGDLLADGTWSDGVDTDSNGFIDDLIGWDVLDNDNDPMDEHSNSHGTHIAGIIGAMHGNEVGIKGINAEVQLMPIRFEPTVNTWTESTAVAAIDYAVLMDVPISSNSWGDGNYYQGIYDAIDRARAADHLFVSAAGNWSVDTDLPESPRYPAGYALDNIVAVAATDFYDQLADFSNWGLTSVDLAAPGKATLSSRGGDTYGYGSGTSYATPHVAGTAALVQGLYPNWTADQIKAQIFATVDPLPTLQGKMVTGGRLNAASAVAPLSEPPTAVADAYGVPEDGQLNVSAPGVLANDNDAEGDPLTAVLASNASNGSVTLNPDGSFTYTPNPDFNGPDSFTYEADDGTSQSNVATVAITVDQVNDAPVANGQSVSTDEDMALAITLTGSDADGDLLTYSVVSGPFNGVLSGMEPNLIYTPNANFNGSDSLAFKVNDGTVDSATANVSITINAVNDPPTISDVGDVTIPEDTATAAIPFTIGDLETAASSLTLTGGSSNTTLVHNGNIVFGGSEANRTITVTPAPDQFGSATITVTVSDGSENAQDTFLLTVTSVNDAPVADDQSVSAKENTAKPITLTANDVDGDGLTYSTLSDPNHGTLSGTAPNLTYMPNTGYTGPDSFTFRANDAAVDSNVATVSITVAANNPPVADPQSVSLVEDTSLPIMLTGSDPDGDPVTYSIISSPSNGGLSGTAPDLTYTPNTDFNGADSFTFRVNDGTDDSPLATVAITVTAVNDPPVADAQSVLTDEDTALVITLTGSDIDGDALIHTVVTGPGNGSLTGAAPNLTYTPSADFNGADSFTFKVNDGTVDSPVATVSITVSAVNDAPLASAENYSLDQDTTLSVAAPGVLGNDSDVDGDPLSAVLDIAPASGLLTLNSDGSFDYTPDAGFVGSDSFSYQAKDPDNAISPPVTVSLTVNAVAAGPNLAHGTITGVASSWQIVALSESYTSMVVVATPRYNAGSGPGVVRIRNVTGNSFEVRVDNVGSAAFSGDVQYVAVEEGVYDEAGFKLEAQKTTSTWTSRKNAWQIGSVSYQQSYASPVVVGQVMTANDPDWSVFWASSGSRTSPPSSSQLNLGKHVAEDPDTTRANETIGYLVIEATQNGVIEGLPFVAGVGGDSVRGVGNGTFQYSYTAMPNAKTAVLSSAGMDGGDGGWPVLYGNNPLPPSAGTIDLAIDEDQLGDPERNHTTEQVAYFVIDPPLRQTVDTQATTDSQVALVIGSLQPKQAVDVEASPADRTDSERTQQDPPDLPREPEPTGAAAAHRISAPIVASARASMNHQTLDELFSHSRHWEPLVDEGLLDQLL